MHLVSVQKSRLEMWVWQTEPEFLDLRVTPQLEQKIKK